MALIGFLILFPLLVAGVLLVARNETARRVIVCAAAVVIGVGSIWLVMAWERRGCRLNSLLELSMRYAPS